MRRSLFLLLAFSFCFSSSFFVASSGSMESRASAYNSRLEEVPPPLRFLFSGESANIHVSGLGDYYAEFGDRGEVTLVEGGARQDASLEVSTDTRTVDLLNSGKITLDDAVREKLLAFRDRNLIVAVKMQIALSFVHLGGVWDGIFGPGMDRASASMQ
jgi:hypothetical protein